MSDLSQYDEDTQLAVALYDYRRAVRAAFGYIDVQKRGNFENVSKVEIGRQFVFPQLSPRHISPREEPSAWGETTPLLTALKEFSTLTVLGDPGSGKSTIVAWIAQMLADPGPNIYKTTFPGVVPLPFVLRDLRLEATDQWEQLLEAFLTQGFAENLNIDQVRRLLADGRAFVLVDGLDEVSDPEVRTAVRNALLQGQLVSEGNRWLFTSRIVGYTLAAVFAPGAKKFVRTFSRAGRLHREGAERGKELTEAEYLHPVVADLIPETNHPDALLVEPPLRYVTPFLPDAVAQFAKNWFNLREPEPANAEKRAREFLAALSSRGDLSELARTPQLLGMMCLVHYYQARLPDGRAELYQSVVRAYLIDIPRIIGRDIAVDPEDRIRWLSAIGFQMQRQRTASEEEEEDHDAVGVTVPEPTLRGWLADIGVAKDQITVFIHFLGRRAGLLLPRGKDEDGNEVYAFLHLSFQEYFAARYLAERDPTQPRSSALASLGLAEPSSGGDVDKEQFLAWSRDPVWQETFRLLFQIHGPSQADNLAGELFTELARLVEGAIEGETHAIEAVGNLGYLLSDVVLDGKSRISEAARRGLWARLIECEFQSQKASSRIADALDERISISYILDLLNLSTRPHAASLSPEQLEAATALDLRFTPVSDLVPLKELKQLTTLVLWHTRVSDVEPIKELKHLTTLDLSDTLVSDLVPLKELKQLTILELWGTQVSDLEPIKELKQLAELYLTGTQVSDLEPIKELKQLTRLVLSKTQVSDLRPIKELKHLTMLSLSRTQVSDLSPIKELRELTTLNLHNTQVSDLEPIKELKQLTTLDLHNTQVSEAQKEELKKHLPNLKIIG